MIKTIKSRWAVLLLTILVFPTVAGMFRSGLYSMQDFPYFRLVEYTKCVENMIFPCRWAPDAGLGYGEPVFNFYSHVPFLLGSVLMILGVSGITSLKLLFAISIVGSAVSMYLLSKTLWKNNYSALVSAVLFTYAPYRAVNVWVRGALPEAFAFIFLPLILWVFEIHLKTKKTFLLISLACLTSLLILTHNLSVVLFSVTILLYFLVRLKQEGKLRSLWKYVLAGGFGVILSSFYLLPAVFESNLVNLQSTTTGYFDFRAHFVTLPQLFISTNWGYGGSTWGNEDGLSLSIGHVQWVTAIILLLVSFFRLRKESGPKKELFIVIFLVAISAFTLFLTHNKSTFIWITILDWMKYIQFPWRFLGISLFTISLAAGFLPAAYAKQRKFIAVLIIVIAVYFNKPFFKEDFFINKGDEMLQNGADFIEQSRASINDYWPVFGSTPTVHSSVDFPDLVSEKTGNSQKFQLDIQKSTAKEFPIAFFPGWRAFVNGVPKDISYSKRGLITVFLPEGEQQVELKFANTFVRTLGNTISVITFLVLFLGSRYKRFKDLL